MITSILIIEDNDKDSELMFTNVQSQCENIKRVRTLADGIRQMRIEPPDVVMLDVGLPDVDTPDQAIAAVKSIRTDRTAIAVVSNLDDPEIIRRAILNNVDAWIPKGNWGVLLHEIRAAHDQFRYRTGRQALIDSVKSQQNKERR